MTEQKNQANRLLPFPVIAAAVHGDVEAVNAVLKHYEGYIMALSSKHLYDDYGQRYLCIDEDLRRKLETKLIAKVLSFNLT